eukprot:scaffold992_cov70-Skeletonema_dohrnii-CCMP3373.AAC.1
MTSKDKLGVWLWRGCVAAGGACPPILPPRPCRAVLIKIPKLKLPTQLTILSSGDEAEDRRPSHPRCCFEPSTLYSSPPYQRKQL